MAKTKAVWGIDIGQCALKAVKLSYDAKEDKAVLEAFDFVEHPKILSQPDAEPDELIRSALTQFLSRNDIDEQIVYLSVPGQAGLARVVKLPPVESKKVADIVKFEANQQIPFKLDDVSWDYQLLGSGEVTEGYVVDAEVGIFAIKKENVGRYLMPLDRNGVEVDTVQLAPVALYNFAAFDQFLHATQKIESPAGGAAEEAAAAEEEGDTVVILDIGADNTDLVVTNGDSIWMRNLPIGGNHFTRALTKELKLTFAKAEHMKRNATKAPDPKKLYQAMRPVFQDFANELQRSIGFFSSTNRQRQIRKIIGVGNGFKLPGLQKFLQQHLQYPVDKVQGFHGLRGDSLAEPVFVENVSSFCVAYGLALQGLKQTPVQTNLLPQEIRTRRMIRDKKPWTLTAAAAVLLGFGAMFLGSYNALSAVKNPALTGPKSQADSAVSEFKKLQSDYDSAKGEYKKTFEDDISHVGFKTAEKRLQWVQVHVLVEKPLSLELPEARAIAGLAAAGGTVTAVSFNWRYAPRVQAAWQAVQAGEIGPIREVRAATSIVAGPAFFGLLRQKPWSTRREHGGGMLREAGTHVFDRVRFLTGQEFRRVAGRLTPFAAVPWPVPEAAGATADLEFALLAELADGSLASLQVALTAAAGGEQLVLSGAEGVLTVGPAGVLRQRAGEAAAAPLEIPPADQAPADVPLMQHTWNRLIADFVAAVRAGDVRHATVPHLPTIEDGLRAQEVVAAAERADAERRWVDLADLA